MIKAIQDLKLQKAQIDAWIASFLKYIPPHRQGNDNTRPLDPSKAPQNHMRN